jgi:molecular chaperone HtpG
VIDSPDIPLNVSRSYLQMDRTVKQLSGHISKKVADSLTSLYRTDRNRFIDAWENVGLVVKLGLLEDEKFYERVKEILIWKTTDGVWTTIEEYLERCKGDKIIYTKEESHLIPLFKEKGYEILYASSPIDPYVMQFLERKLSGPTFQRIDGAMHDHLLDKSREKTVLDASGKTEAAHLADFIRAKLDNENCEVEARSLSSDQLPGFIIIDEHQRRMRDYFLTLDPQGSMSHLVKHTFVINTNNPLLSSAYKLAKKNPELSKDIVQQVYELSLLSQREIEPERLNDFIARSNRVMQGLAEQVDID